MDMVNVKVNGIAVSVPQGSTILEAARAAGVEIPTLCFLKDLNEIGACRICVVEATGARGLVTACVYPVSEGMEIQTNTKKVQDARRTTLELILSTHNKKCLSCVRSTDCELQKLCRDYGVEDSGKYDGFRPEYELDTSAVHLVRDNNKCVLCRRCVAACKNQYVSVIGANDRGIDTQISCAFDRPLDTVPCVSCGQCVVACPTGALTERDDTDKAWAAINDPEKHVVFQTAPAVRAALGESFGMPIGTNVEGKMVAAIRRLGVDRVFDTDVAADFTIVEEATEFVERVKNGGTLPMITSCSPGWIKFIEYYYPEQLGHLSSCKSPHEMMGAMVKTYYAKKNNIDPKDIVVVSVMPCTAKKFEIGRDDENASGYPDVDISLTTRELARMIERAGIQFTALEDEAFDDPFGEGSGAAVIFGATGGVMEAALRTANDWLTGKDNEPASFPELRGTEGMKEATYNIAGMEIKVCVVSGIQNANKVMSMIKDGTAPWQFVEVMCCPGGCVTGGGQPIQPASVLNTTDLKALRAKALYSQDDAMKLRKSHESQAVKTVYEEYYTEGYGKGQAHHDLHTSYIARKQYK